MDLRLFFTVFATVFLAELGDKTQLATMIYAADAQHPRLTIFLASAAALVLSAGLAVAAGSVISQLARPELLRWAAGLSFIAVGVWVLIGHD